MRRQFAVRLSILLLCCIGLVSPGFVFPVTSTSCLPLAVDSCCISLTCAIALPRVFWLCFWPQRDPKRWPQDSRARAYWILGHEVVAIVGGALFLTSLFLFRSWHRGMINWQMIISAPGVMFWLWAGMIKVYVAERDPEPSQSSLPGPWMARILGAPTSHSE